MLPHIKYKPNMETWIKRLSSFIPLIFMGVYYMNVHDSSCAVNFSDPLGYYNPKWGKNATVISNATYFKNKSVNVSANITYTYYPYNKFVAMSAFGTGTK